MAKINAWGSDDPAEVAKGGTGASSLSDGHVLLGSGTDPVTALDVTAKGSLLVGDGTTDPQALAVGTDTHVLTADSAQGVGIKWAAAAAASGGITFLSSATASNDSSLEFSSSIDSTYNLYLFVFENIDPSSSLETFRMRTSTNGGSSFDSGNNDYMWSITGSRIGTAIDDGTASGDEIAISSNTVKPTTSSNSLLSGYLLLHAPSSTEYTHCQYSLTYRNTNHTVTYGAGFRAAAEDVDAVQFSFASGNISSGTIRMYGMTTPS